MPDFVPINLHVVERRRDTVFANAIHQHIGQVVAVDNLAGCILPWLPAGTHYDTVFESVRYLAGVQLTELEAMRLAWRLAGNLDRLRNGMSAPPWASQQSDEWVPLQVLKYVPDINAKRRRGYTVTFRVLAGTPAPMKITTFWGMPACKYVAFRVGFSKPWGSYPFSRVSDFVGLRLYGLINAAKSRGTPVFHDIECTPGLQQWNRNNVLKLRFRVKQQCPRNYSHACHQCAIGCDQCPAATHPVTYTIGRCGHCGKDEVLFDPDDKTTTYCITCGRAERIKRQSAK